MICFIWLTFSWRIAERFFISLSISSLTNKLDSSVGRKPSFAVQFCFRLLFVAIILLIDPSNGLQACLLSTLKHQLMWCTCVFPTIIMLINKFYSKYILLVLKLVQLKNLSFDYVIFWIFIFFNVKYIFCRIFSHIVEYSFNILYFYK